MATRWIPKQSTTRTSLGWFCALLLFVVASTGCHDALDDGEDLAVDSAPLFVDFQRHYDAPTEPYFITDQILAVNPVESERLPLVIRPEAQKINPDILRDAQVMDEMIRIPRGAYDAAADVQPGEVVISGLTGADFWRKVEAVEVVDDYIIWHTVDAHIVDVVLEGDFHLQVEPGYNLPEGFNLMDIYLDSDLRTFEQRLEADCSGQPQPCNCMTLIIDEMLDDTHEDDEAWLAAQNWAYLGARSSHNNWLQNRSNHEDEEDRGALFTAAQNNCVNVHGFNASSAQSQYLSDFNNTNTATPNPPSFQCLEAFLHDKMLAEARAESGNSNMSVAEVCELTATSGEDGGQRDMENEMSNAFEQDLALDAPGFSQNLITDQVCLDNCQSSEDVAACEAECPSFRECASLGSGGEFCFQLTEVSVSYEPTFTFSIRIRPWSVKATAGFVGPLTVKIGAMVTANYSFNWEQTKDFNFPIPGLSFGLGPLTFGVAIYAEFGLSFNFDASGTIEATYTKVYDAGVELSLGVPSGVSFNPVFEKNDDLSGAEIRATADISARLQAWAEAGVALVAGIPDLSALSSGDLGSAISSQRILWITPIRAVFSASAAIRPPSCPYDIGVFFTGEMGYSIDLGFISRSGTKTLYGPIYLFRLRGGLEEFITPLQHFCGVSMDPPVFDGVEPDECFGGADSCPDAGQACVQGQCVDNEGLRLTLQWTNEVDLDLMVITPSGQIHGASINNVDQFTHHSCGGVCEGDTPKGTYIENIVFSDPEPGFYTFYVAKNGANAAQPELDRYGYQIELEHEGVGVQQFEGHVDSAFEEMPVSFRYCVPGGQQC